MTTACSAPRPPPLRPPRDPAQRESGGGGGAPSVSVASSSGTAMCSAVSHSEREADGGPKDRPLLPATGAAHRGPRVRGQRSQASGVRGDRPQGSEVKGLRGQRSMPQVCPSIASSTGNQRDRNPLTEPCYRETVTLLQNPVTERP
jgi:hypothetical protein